MQLVQRGAWVATILTYFLITLGGTVLATGSGLSCPDWPFCYGQAYHAGTYHTFLEQFHRFTAATVSILIVLLVLGILTRARHDRSLVVLAIAAPVLLALQIILGGLTVLWQLPPQIITAHLGTALVLLALVISIAVLSAKQAPGESDTERVAPVSAHAFASLAIANALLVYVLMLLGSYVTGSAAALACTGWPFCTPASFGLHNHLATINILHRVVAAVAGLVTLATVMGAWRRRHAAPGQALIAVVGGTLFVCQAIVGGVIAVVGGTLFVCQAVVGGVIVLDREPVFVVGLHLALGAAVWGTQALLAALAYQRLRAVTQPSAPSYG